MTFFMQRTLLVSVLSLAAPIALATRADGQGSGIQATSARVGGPPVRRIESASALSSEPLGSITTVRQLPNGRLLLNDGTRRRLLMLDSTLSVIKVVLDSLTEVQNAYGTRPGALIAYRGDSTLFVDPATYAMLVIDGDGNIARVRSVPRATDVGYLTMAAVGNGVSSFDAQGRLVYRVPAQAKYPAGRPSSDIPFIPEQPDSAFVVAINMNTRKLDTLGAVRIPKQIIAFTRSDFGFEVRSTVSPLPLVDEWAVLPDGTVAFVRGRDYRVDYLHSDGSLTSSPKLPFPWVRMEEDEKITFADSVKVAQTRDAQRNFLLQMIVWSNVLNKPYPTTFSAAPETELPPGIPRDWILPTGMKFPPNYIYGCPPNSAGAASAGGAAAGGAAAGTATVTLGASASVGAPASPGCVSSNYSSFYGSGYTPPAPTYRPPTFVPVSALPDYKPPIAANAVRADADGNLWIRTMPMKQTPGGTVYDIVNPAGVMSDRIQLPPSYALVSFGADRIVYLSMRDATGLHLARVRLR